ncbi:MAG: enoyl-CoA hydratase-related protein [Congregibacter sp.]
MTDSLKTDRVQLTTDPQGIARLRLNRPEKHNAFDDAMIADISACLTQFHGTTDARVLILESAGRSFSAGGDLAWMQRMADYDFADNLEDARGLATMLQLLKTLPVPSIARIQGSAFGGAIGLICCCDIAVSLTGAKFGLTEARIGLVPATIGPHVVEALGPRWARRLFITAERFGAVQARDIGLVHELAEDEEMLDTRIEQLAAELMLNSPQAMREGKQLVRELHGRPLDAELIEHTSALIARLRVSDEGQEGLQAFLGKRPPRWTETTTPGEGKHV